MLRIDTKHAAVGLLAFGAAIVGRMLVHSSALEWVGWSFVLVFALLRVRLWIAPPANTNPHGPQK